MNNEALLFLIIFSSGMMILIISSIVICHYISKKQKKKEKEKKEAFLAKHLPVMTENYEYLKSFVSIPENCPMIDMNATVFGREFFTWCSKYHYTKNNFYMWTDEKYLYIFPTEKHISKEQIDYSYKEYIRVREKKDPLINDDISLRKIPINNIEYFGIQGEERYETKIETTNKGINATGALVGGVLAGEAGAAIGSQYGKNTISSRTIHHDDRICELIYKSKDKIKKLKLSINAYEYLENLIPEKEFKYVSSLSANKKESNKFDEIKEYKELLDNGIISMEDFEKKKKELFNL